MTVSLQRNLQPLEPGSSTATTATLELTMCNALPEVIEEFAYPMGVEGTAEMEHRIPLPPQHTSIW
jgi:hypothetical protein